MQDTEKSSSTSKLLYRRAWKKDPKTNERVWPCDLEDCLIEGLEKFRDQQKHNNRSSFISCYIKEKTRKYRSPSQISSRIQMILKAIKKILENHATTEKRATEENQVAEENQAAEENQKLKNLAELIITTQRKSPRPPPHTHVFRLDSVSDSPQQLEAYGLSYEDKKRTPSPLSSNAGLLPYFESHNAQALWNQGNLPVDYWPLDVNHPQPYLVEGGAIESIYSPDASTAACSEYNDSLLQGQAYNYLQPYASQSSFGIPENSTHAGAVGEPNFQLDADFWKWYEYQQ